MDIRTLRLNAVMGTLDWHGIGPSELVRLIDYWEGDGRTFVGIVRRAVELTDLTLRTLADELPESGWKQPAQTPAARAVRMSRLLRAVKPKTQAAWHILQTIRLRLPADQAPTRDTGPDRRRPAPRRPETQNRPL